MLSRAFYHWSTDETTALTDDLDLGANWSDDGEGRRVTVAGLFATPRGPKQVDPGPAQAVAQAAVSAVASLL